VPEHDAGTEPLVRKRGLMSPLTRRILALNVLALAILVGGLLYLGEYRKSLIETKLTALQTQGEVLAASLGEGAVTTGFIDRPHLVPFLAKGMIIRLVEPTGVRARLFGVEGALLADSLTLPGAGRAVSSRDLPEREGFRSWLNGLFDRIDGLFFSTNGPLPAPEEVPYSEPKIPGAIDFDEVMSALQGKSARTLRAERGEGMILYVAVPVRRYKLIVGAILLSREGEDILATLRSVRLDILKIFAVTLAVTVLLSLYLAGTIARPIHHLAEAAERVRRHHDRHVAIPDFTGRGDEIGDLSGAFRDMTAALWQRMDAIESFAADVAHEIKNPLTSLRSAVETAANVKDPGQQRKLLAVVLDDIQRIDRLISDISDASRLDAELSRATRTPVDVAGLLTTLSDMPSTTSGGGKPTLTVEAETGTDLQVPAIEGRLVQVFRNLIANAVSFSPLEGRITCRVTRESSEDGDLVTVAIEDQGPGIPENKRETIFERFYTERPEGEKFGIHSGLGLSISRQIVEAHGGTLRAENLTGEDGKVGGARFTVRLPCE
jgi:two-component system sensor histidine kinase ChvG